MKRPYSLSRTQQAFWFWLSVLAYLFVWLMTGELDSLSSSVLVLISISSGTALASEALTGTHALKLGQKAAKLRADRTKLQKSQDAAKQSGAAPTELVAAQAALDLNQETLEKTEASIAKDDSQGFFLDLVRDSHGVSLQRAQIAVWTVVLGGIFVHEVYALLTMPEFSSTLLSLMGISSGTYLAGKTVSGAATETSGT